MNKPFCDWFSRPPVRRYDGIYYYDSDRDADCFDESDVDIWRSGRMRRNFHSDFFLNNPASRRLVDAIIAQGDPVVEIACGPGMGLMPSVKQLAPDHVCLATDANSLVIEEWKRYLDGNETIKNLDLAQFSLMDIPFRDNTVPAYSGYIGLSSTRNGEEGHERALREIHRTLTGNGFFYTIETWMDTEAMLRVFRESGMTPWGGLESDHPTPTWRERFLQVGFEIVSEDVFESRTLTADDNELGEAAEQLGIGISVISKAYILQKN